MLPSTYTLIIRIVRYIFSKFIEVFDSLQVVISLDSRHLVHDDLQADCHKPNKSVSLPG